jgi:hypothetical protein
MIEARRVRKQEQYRAASQGAPGATMDAAE